MKVKTDWLRELVDLTDITTEDIVNKISLHSGEVESVYSIIDASSIVVGHVLTKEKHPDSDHLSVLQVDVGTETVQIICGASNVAADQYVIVALNGAVLPGNFKIKKSKIRGIESNGMVCSLQELGLEKKFIREEFANGIFYFDQPLPVGMDGKKALGFADDVIELGLTPNRSDLLSMLGVAQECSAMFKRNLLPVKADVCHTPSKEKINLKLDTPLCLTYYGQLIRNVVVKPSPVWLSNRLIAFGIRPINNLVDITNYILALYGQPLHAFDYDKLGNTIVVRNALPDEEITTLDEVKRNLDRNDLVITNGAKPVAIAGVMGGLETEVTGSTKNIVLEAAVFDPLSIRRTSSRLNLRSESSVRFERGIDLNRTQEALQYACYLYQTLADAVIDESVAFAGIKHVSDKKIKVTGLDIQHVLGIEIPENEIKQICHWLGFIREEEWIIVPNRRLDITIKEDCIEEIGRMYGYFHLESTYPVDNMVGALSLEQKRIRELKNILSHYGLYELITYSLVNEQESREFSFNHSNQAKALKILSPLTEEHQFLRQELLPSVLQVCQYNYSHKNSNASYFEIGKVYCELDGKTKEVKHLAGAMSNLFTDTLWNNKQERVDFFLVKGLLENAFQIMGWELTFQPLEEKTTELHPNRSAAIYYGNQKVGILGQLHPSYALTKDLDEMIVFDINLESFLQSSPNEVVFTSIPKLPSVQRDISIVIKKDILANDIIQQVKKSDRNIISVKLFDYYVGEKVADDEKSIAMNIVFSSEDPLTDEIIKQKMDRITKGLVKMFAATLRT